MDQFGANQDYKYADLAQQGQTANNQQNLNSALGFGDMNLRGMGQNAANWANQAGFDQNAQQRMQQNQQFYGGQLFGQYGQAAGLGTPQAQSQLVENPWLSGAKLAGGLASNFFGGGGGGPAFAPAQFSPAPQQSFNPGSFNQPLPGMGAGNYYTPQSANGGWGGFNTGGIPNFYQQGR